MAKGEGPPLTITDRLADAYGSTLSYDFVTAPFPKALDGGIEQAIACQAYWVIFTLQWPGVAIYALVGKE